MIRLHWSSWGAAGAQGTGQFYTNSCQPTCAHGTARLYPVDLVAWRVYDGAYTRLRYDFPGHVPPGFSRTWTISYYSGAWHGRVV